jgi:hypothetical protein
MAGKRTEEGVKKPFTTTLNESVQFKFNEQSIAIIPQPVNINGSEYCVTIRNTIPVAE